MRKDKDFEFNLDTFEKRKMTDIFLSKLSNLQYVEENYGKEYINYDRVLSKAIKIDDIDLIHKVFMDKDRLINVSDAQAYATIDYLFENEFEQTIEHIIQRANIDNLLNSKIIENSVLTNNLDFLKLEYENRNINFNENLCESMVYKASIGKLTAEQLSSYRDFISNYESKEDFIPTMMKVAATYNLTSFISNTLDNYDFNEIFPRDNENTNQNIMEIRNLLEDKQFIGLSQRIERLEEKSMREEISL